MRTVADVAAATAGRPYHRMDAPPYTPCGVSLHAFMVESMRSHTTDEGYQLALALREGGYELHGHGFDGQTDIAGALKGIDAKTVVVQDKREWLGKTAGPGFDFRERFTNVHWLRHQPVFRVTVLKDAHADAELHVGAADELAAHAWVTYYHSDIVAAQASYVRKEHLVRTYHSVDKAVVPKFHERRRNFAALSGAISHAYPLRLRLAKAAQHGQTSHIDYYQHPGYGRFRCCTPDYLRTLSQYKVAVCTSSKYGYALRKIVEAAACGCTVITDLPLDEVLPHIALHHVSPDAEPAEVDQLVERLCGEWDAAQQAEAAARVTDFYDYRRLGRVLAADIEKLRLSYNG